MPTLSVDFSTGTPRIQLSSIKKIAIANITTVQSHVVLREGELTRHKITWLGGASADIAYYADGTIERFIGLELSTSITDDDDGKPIVTLDRQES